MWLDVAFDESKTGLATIGYRLYNNTGGDAQARTTTGVVEIGHGAYGVTIASVPSNAVGVEWDTGDADIVYAFETLLLETFTATDRTTLNTIDTNVTTISLDVAYLLKSLKNYRQIIKIATSWYLVVYDTGQGVGGTEILRKKLVDVNGVDITDLEAGKLARELENSV